MKLYAVAIGGGTSNKVTVIVPIFNTEKYLNKCLNSIVNQTYKNLEIILIDDGSRDESAEIAKYYEETDERVWLFQQKNAGVSVARNTGLELANGEYVLMIDSDDWIEPDMISILVENIQATESDISCCQYDKSIRSDIDELEKWEQHQALETFIIHQKMNGSLVNKLIKREILQGISFDSTICYGEDALFCWKALLRANSLCITNKVLYHVVMHNDSASGGGSYKPIRRDCISVWSIISNEAEQLDENLGDMAKAQLANMAYYSLYEMMYYNYGNEEDEKIFIEILVNLYQTLKTATFIPKKVKVMAKIILTNKNIASMMVSIARRK